MKRFFVDEDGLPNLWGIFGIILPLLIVLVFFGLHSLEAQACDTREANYNRETKYQIFGGCFVELDDGTWIEVEKYRRHENVEDQ